MQLLCSYEYFKNICDLEKKEIEINIDPFVFEEMLHYIITGRLSPTISFDALKTLIQVSYTYTIKDLLLECEEHLIQDVSITTVIDLFFLAFSIDADNLKAYTTKFFKFYLKEIVCRVNAPSVAIAPILAIFVIY
ncbi:Speckle-type POZ protein-like protein [Ooceraea biroi]|uniref:Speckle-type POZ protein-like protein n=1 Tax=Ooceraea biroi TaxID=2015173 RepID=A0A026W1W8_OOCBI|nr:Speckle-type POZ protein-like protein [Ooceraea biroi]